MRRTQSHTVTVIVIAAGLAVAAGGILLPRDSRQVVTGFVETLRIKHQVRALDPQTEDEYWHDLETTEDLVIAHPNAFIPEWFGWPEAVELLITDASGKRKPWVTDQLRGWGILALTNGAEHRPINEEGRPGEEWLLGSWAWHSQRALLIGKAIASLSLSSGVIGLGLFALPLLVVLLLAVLLAVGRMSHPPPVQVLAQPQIEQRVDHPGGDAAHEPQPPEPAAPIIWPLIVVIAIVALVRDLRQALRIVRPTVSRAPPFTRKEMPCFAWSV